MKSMAERDLRTVLLLHENGKEYNFIRRFIFPKDQLGFLVIKIV